MQVNYNKNIIIKYGLTLIELMLVIVILGLTIGLVTLASKPSASRQIKQDAEYLGDMLDSVQQEAEQMGNNITVTINNQGINTDYTSSNNLLNKYKWNLDNIQVKYGWKAINNAIWQRVITPEAVQNPYYVILSIDNYSVTLYGDGGGSYQIQEFTTQK